MTVMSYHSHRVVVVMSFGTTCKGDILDPNSLMKDKEVLRNQFDFILLERDGLLKELVKVMKLLEYT